MDKDRQLYQLHKEGYEKIAKAITDLELKVEIEVKDCSVTSTEITDEEETD